jgi:hypothetical protein
VTIWSCWKFAKTPQQPKSTFDVPAGCPRRSAASAPSTIHYRNRQNPLPPAARIALGGWEADAQALLAARAAIITLAGG